MDEFITLPNINYWSLDSIYLRVNKLVYGQQVVMDLANIKFLEPPGVIMLLLLTIEINYKTGEVVSLLNIHNDVQCYLQRVGFFNFDHIHCNYQKNDRYGVYPNSVIAITRLKSYSEVSELSAHYLEILKTWFDYKHLERYCSDAWSVMSEICNNSIEHSQLGGDTGECYCIVQKYTRGFFPEVCLSVGDVGVGIRKHLIQKYGVLPSSDSECIQLALAGTSGRLSGGGGMGLQLIKSITQNHNGYMIVRSGKGLVKIDDQEHHSEFKQLFPGTQSVINLRPITFRSSPF